MLYLGALGDRYGRKLMLVLGTALSIPASLLAAFAPSIGVLFVARAARRARGRHGVPDDARADHRAVVGAGPHASRSRCGRRSAARSPRSARCVAGALLEHFWWGSVFLVTLPLALVALVMAWHVRPGARERDDRAGRQPRRHPLGRAGRRRWCWRSTSRRCPNKGTLALGLAAIAAAAARRRSCSASGARANPLYDLDVAARRTFWVAACAGIIVFGSLMGADVRRPAVPAERARLLDARRRRRDPAGGRAAWCSSRRARRSSSRRAARGSRCSVGYVFCLLGFLDDAAALEGGHLATGRSALGYAFIGIGVGFAGTPASHSLTGSVPVRRAGMASGTADLQRDLGGAIMQSILGALLTAGYAAAVGRRDRRSPNGAQVTDSVQSELTKSFAERRGRRRSSTRSTLEQIIAAREVRRSSHGDQWAYTAGIVAILLGAALVFFLLPRKRARAGAAGASTRRRTPSRPRPQRPARRHSRRLRVRSTC